MVKKVQRGIYLPLFAILVVVIFTLAGLYFSYAYMLRNKVRISQVADLAALAALESYGRSKNQDQAARKDQARSRAEAFLRNNKLLGTTKSLTSKNGGSDTIIEFGHYYKTLPASPPTICNNMAPCFVPEQNPLDQDINAVKITISTVPTNPIKAPFQNFLFGVNMEVSGSSVATIVPRCTAYLLDVSQSAAFETHKLTPKDSSLVTEITSPPNNDPRFLYSGPANSGDISHGAFAYDASLIYKSFNSSLTTQQQYTFLDAADPFSEFINCKEKIGLLGYPYDDPQRELFCNTGYLDSSLAFFGKRTSDDRHRYRSDYLIHPSFKGKNPLRKWLLIDSYTNPEPLTSFLRAFNVSLREIDNIKSSQDKALAIVFSGDIVDQMPYTGATSELEDLIQVTNFNNRGTMTYSVGVGYEQDQPRISPNAIDRGWIPYFRNNDGTNLVKALYTAIENLSDPNACEPGSLKSIILASDGVGNCTYDNFSVTFPAGNPQGNTVAGTTACDGSFGLTSELDRYNEQEKQLTDPILKLLRARKIALTVLLDGNYVQPHFINRYRNPSDPSKGFVEINEALHYKGTESLKRFFFKTSSICNIATYQDKDLCAIENIGEVGVRFRKPAFALGKMALETGGVYCPLMPLCNENNVNNPTQTCKDNIYINGELNSECRLEGEIQKCSVLEKSQAAQAVKCAVETIGKNPFMLASVRADGTL
jgi:Putative Flp pilus-assembly TadE/G-like